jgi:hypothetical protein
MQRSNFQVALWVLAAAAVGFVIALLIVGGNDNSGDQTNAGATNTTATTTTTGTTGTATGTTTTTSATTATGATPTTPAATTTSCIGLWNGQGNRPAQTFLVNIASRQPIRVHVGQTSDTPPECLVTVIGNDGSAYVFPEGGGATFPYSPSPSTTDSKSLPAAQKTSNALEQRDGTLAER